VFKGNKKVTSAVVGRNVETIGADAFAGCAKLKKVTIRSTKLAEIGSRAFAGCKKLKNITIKSKTLKTKKVIGRETVPIPCNFVKKTLYWEKAPV